MNILAVSCVFPPEPVVSARTSASLARALTFNGDHVTVITAFPNRPSGKLYPGYKRRLFQRESSEDGYEIIRCFATLSAASSIVSRLLENISFGLASGCALLFLPKPDVIYANTWPIVATGILMLIAGLRRIPVVLSIQDIYPESLVAQGRIESKSFWAKLLTRIDTWISHHAETIIVISEKLAQYYRTSRRVNPEKVLVIPNWGDEGSLENQSMELDIRKQYSMDEQDFLVVYGGNIGVAADLETTILSMGYVSEARPVRLLIAGSGSQLSVCRQLAKRVARRKVLVYTPWPNDETSAVLESADVLLLSTLATQSLVSVPSKLITYMFSARPIIALVDEVSDTAEVIRRARCGWILPPGQPKALAALIDQVSLIPKEELESMGRSGQQYALQNLSSSANLPKILAALGSGP